MFGEYVNRAEQVVATVVPVGDDDGLADELVPFVRERAASCKVPRRIVFVAADDVPVVGRARCGPGVLRAACLCTSEGAGHRSGRLGLHTNEAIPRLSPGRWVVGGLRLENAAAAAGAVRVFEEEAIILIPFGRQIIVV